MEQKTREKSTTRVRQYLSAPESPPSTEDNLPSYPGSTNRLDPASLCLILAATSLRDLAAGGLRSPELQVHLALFGFNKLTNKFQTISSKSRSLPLNKFSSWPGR